MDPLAQLRAKIADFPGYDDDLCRRRSDALVRSYLGEALADLAARCDPLPPELQARVDQLLLRVGFADPKSFAVHNGIAAMHQVSEATVTAADAATVELADRASAVAAGDLASYFDDVTATLDRREVAMRAAATASGRP
jgi:hypothetical protein